MAHGSSCDRGWTLDMPVIGGNGKEMCVMCKVLTLLLLAIPISLQPSGCDRARSAKESGIQRYPCQRCRCGIEADAGGLNVSQQREEYLEIATQGIQGRTSRSHRRSIRAWRDAFEQRTSLFSLPFARRGLNRASRVTDRSYSVSEDQRGVVALANLGRERRFDIVLFGDDVSVVRQSVGSDLARVLRGIDPDAARSGATPSARTRR